MTNAYTDVDAETRLAMTDPVPEITDLQNKIDEQSIRIAQAEVRIAEIEAKIRFRATRSLIKLAIGLCGIVLACWYMGYVVYTFWH